MHNIQGIYGILPADLSTTLMLEKAEAAMLGGVRLLQFRDKKNGFQKRLKRAKALQDLCSRYHATLIINDSVQLAQDSGAQGVHLGRDDVDDLSTIRRQVSDHFIVGVTCRADARYAKAALDYGASYLSFGAVFPSHTKADVPVIGLPRFTKACTMFAKANVCGIGGIHLQNLPQIKAAGADMAAVVSSLFDFEPETIQSKAAAMVQMWQNQA